MRSQRAGNGMRVAAWVLVPLGLVVLLGATGGFVGTGGLDREHITVAGDAMRPTYHRGDRLAIERIDEGEIRRGDVLLVTVPGRYRGAPVLQRVIGLGGDHVESRDGTRVTVNGKRIDEPYVMRDIFGSTGAPYEVTVPEGRLFLLGDNRPNANDSRYFLDEQSGSVAVSGVRGRVQEERAAPVAPLVLGALGALLTLVGAGLGIGGFVAGRRPGAWLR
ncbi:signal peptidase I [Streptomyces sp. SLBN-134]|uniref:signal peptidase I n=1 Tax=Streptomyces sp. SLBN-134 TaxID=2768456 RepID=UPI00116F93C1|nr:signal peptidase I [Streptomyces sp. SLBN-134]TQL20497.1 signal peptidase I [Streptomyces sp. SLBN-134]